MLTSYPFAFSALRDGLLDLQNLKGPARDEKIKPYTVGVLAIVTSLALVLRDVGFVNSLCGSMFGSLLLFVLPAIMNISNLKTKAKSVALSAVSKLEMGANYFMVIAGILMTIIGIAVSALKQLGHL